MPGGLFVYRMNNFDNKDEEILKNREGISHFLHIFLLLFFIRA